MQVDHIGEEGQVVSNILRHTGISSTLSLTETSVSANSSGSIQLAGSGSRVHGNGLTDDKPVAHQLSDGLAGVGIADFADLVGVKPDLALAASDDGRREALLSSQIDPGEGHDELARYCDGLESLLLVWLVTPMAFVASFLNDSIPSKLQPNGTE